MRKTVNVIIILLFVAGLGVLLYPHVYGFAYKQQASKVISDFIEAFPEQKTDPSHENTEEPGRIYPELYEAFAEYNKELAKGAQSSLNSNTAYQHFPVSLRDYGFADDLIGYITLPTVEMEQPLYLGASDDNLKAGAAVMGYTSAPIGGENTNCVIAGHNVWNGAKRFESIKKLETGDAVVITTFWGQRKYIVTHMAVIEDNDIASICIQTGKDMVTFMTCCYQNGVKMRYVVFCEFAE